MRNLAGYVLAALGAATIGVAVVLLVIAAFKIVLLFTGGLVLFGLGAWLLAPKLRVNASTYAMNRALAEFSKLLPANTTQPTTEATHG